MIEPATVRVIDWTLGDVVRALRERRGWTQQQLADEAGIDRTVLVRLENGGENKRTTVEKVARGLKVRTADLYDAVPPKLSDGLRAVLAKHDDLDPKAQAVFLVLMQAAMEKAQAHDAAGPVQ